MGCGCVNNNPCTELPKCTCPIKDLYTDCVKYNGPKLECSGVESGTILTKALQKIDAFICSKFDSINSFISLINVGEGARVYKGNNNLGQKEIRSITTTNDNLLEVKETENTIDLIPSIPSLSINGQIVTLSVTNASGDVINLGSIDLGGVDNYVVDMNYNHLPVDGYGANTLVLYLQDGQEVQTDLANLNRYLDSVNYNSSTNNLEFTLNDGITTYTINLLAALQDAQIQSNVLESDTSSPGYIQNKNPSKTETLGSGDTYNVVDSDNIYIIEIDNGPNDVTIDFSAVTATSDFFVGFIQRGTGEVSFTGMDVVPQGLDSKLFGQGHTCALEVINSTKYLIGQLKSV